MTVCYWCGAKDALADVGKELDDGKYKMVQCQKCKNAYYVVNKEKMNKPKPMTNEEWLKLLDTEGLVDYLYEVHKGGDSVERQRWIERHKEQVKMQFRGWLKQPHKE